MLSEVELPMTLDTAHPAMARPCSVLGTPVRAGTSGLP